MEKSTEEEDEVIVSDSEDLDPALTAAARLAEQRAKIVRICEQIRQPYYPLMGDHISAFLNVANESKLGSFNICVQHMCSTTLQQTHERYEEHAIRWADGVQIIYQGATGEEDLESTGEMRKKIRTVQQLEFGHYVCIHYVWSVQTVYVYDSLHNSDDFVDNLEDPSAGRINKRTREIIYKLYPHHKKRIAVRPFTRQTDGSSCGVFAAAYATMVLFKKDPATYALKIGDSSQGGDTTMEIRNHLAKIIEENQLTLFPSM